MVLVVRCTVQIWDIQEGRQVRVLTGHKGEVDAVVTALDNRHVVSGGREMIVLFVCRCTYQELASTESADPVPTNLGLGTLELNAYRAKREWRKKLEMWKQAETCSELIPWSMDNYDRTG